MIDTPTKEDPVINRLILIGNGFDLAHGLNTRYKDFITDYLWNAINQFYAARVYDDDLIKIHYKVGGITHGIRKVEPVYETLVNEIKRLNSTQDYIETEFHFKSLFLQSLVTKCSASNWVDIEMEYFQHLKASASANLTKVEKLNSEFEYLKSKLHEYLKKINKEGKSKYNSKFTNLFCRKILKHEVVKKELKDDIMPQQLYALNFNYTGTFYHYDQKCHEKINTVVNHIHGELSAEYNPIIFGFGDEYDKEYKEFELKNNNSLFPHIKSFSYFRTDNYHNLLRFIDGCEFQVYVMGHSCGLSDRTMLKYIFEHQNCISIKIFYHESIEKFTETTYEIARHFDNKSDMRKKIVPFDFSEPMPQMLK